MIIQVKSFVWHLLGDKDSYFFTSGGSTGYEEITFFLKKKNSTIKNSNWIRYASYFIPKGKVGRQEC